MPNLTNCLVRGLFNSTSLKTDLTLAAIRVKRRIGVEAATAATLNSDLAADLARGTECSARVKAEQLIVCRRFTNALDVLLTFLKWLTQRTGNISSFSSLPPDYTECVQSIIYCAERLGDIKELRAIKRQLRYHFGRSLVYRASQNEERSVNPVIVEHFSGQPPTEREILNCLRDVSEENEIFWMSPSPQMKLSSSTLTGTSGVHMSDKRFMADSAAGDSLSSDTGPDQRGASFTLGPALAQYDYRCTAQDNSWNGGGVPPAVNDNLRWLTQSHSQTEPCGSSDCSLNAPRNGDGGGRNDKIVGEEEDVQLDSEFIPSPFLAPTRRPRGQ